MENKTGTLSFHIHTYKMSKDFKFQSEPHVTIDDAIKAMIKSTAAKVTGEIVEVASNLVNSFSPSSPNTESCKGDERHRNSLK